MGGCKCLFIVFAVLGLVFIVVGCILGFLVLDDVVQDQVEKQVQLENGTLQYERWEELPFALTFKVYMFQITNPNEILTGAKPIVEEVGPYIYSQSRRKHSIEWNEDEDSLFYYQNQLFEFDAEKSAPLREDDTLTVLFAPYYGVIQSVESLPTWMLPNLDEELSDAFPASSLFTEVTVKKYLFEGYTFCSGLSGMVCEIVKEASSQIKTIEVVEDDENGSAMSFAFLKYKNNTHDGSYKITAGLKTIDDLGFIREWENSTDLIDTWVDNTTCSSVRGRDSTIYPPFIEEEDTFDIFSTDICRVVTLEYTNNEEYMGITGQRRQLKRDTLGNTEENECFCVRDFLGGTTPIDNSEKCLPDGFMDLYTCMGAAVVLSFPHFLWGDETYKSTVDGLNAVEEDHVTFVVLEPGTGTPLQGAKRVQFNMILRPISRVTALTNVEPAVIPLMWIEEGTELPEDLVDELKDKYLNKLILVAVVTWVLIGLGIALVVVFTACYFWKK